MNQYIQCRWAFVSLSISEIVGNDMLLRVSAACFESGG